MSNAGDRKRTFPGGSAEGPLPRRTPLTFSLLAMAAIFGLLGLFFVLAPRTGAVFFGMPITGSDGVFYVRALGLRDAALALYIALQTLSAPRRAVFLLLAATPIIPAGDLTLLLLRSAWTANLLLHVFSAVCFAGMAAWVRASSRRDPSHRAYK